MLAAKVAADADAPQGHAASWSGALPGFCVRKRAVARRVPAIRMSSGKLQNESETLTIRALESAVKAAKGSTGS
jgi:hypothetical protein